MARGSGTLGVGFVLLGAGVLGLLAAHARQSHAAERPDDPEPVPPEPPPSGLEERFSVEGRSYRLTRHAEGRYSIELLDGATVRAAYHYGPDGLESIDGEPDDIALIARDKSSFPQSIPEFSTAVIEPPSDSPVDYSPLD